MTRGRRASLVVVVVVAALVWPLALVTRADHPAAIIGAGRTGPAAPLLARELPVAAIVGGTGHDGQQFYAIARAGVRLRDAVPYLDAPAYRLRRIAFPFLAGALAPGVGTVLVATLLVVSLLGVALGAWALSRLPQAPPWLPFVLVASPGVGIALALSLADALAVGLVLAAFTLVGDRRWVVATVVLVLAGLTRETTVLAALAMLAAPELPRARRAVLALVPVSVVGGWAAFLHVWLGPSAGGGDRAQFALPLIGWASPAVDVGSRVFGLLLLAVLACGAMRLVAHPARRHVAAYVIATCAMGVVLSDDVTSSWANSGRALAPALPLAVWGIASARGPALDRSAAVVAGTT